MASNFDKCKTFKNFAGKVLAKAFFKMIPVPALIKI